LVKALCFAKELASTLELILGGKIDELMNKNLIYIKKASKVW
jgi:hypothetical protein